MRMETLDVGCGNADLAKGTVNIDSCRGGVNPQVGNQTTGEQMSVKRIPNFVVADACHLPFRSKAFQASFSSHTIEHVKSNPALMLKEMHRVTKGRVSVRCPHRRGSGAKRPFHMHYLDEQWFLGTAEKLNVQCELFITALDYPLTNRLPFISRAVWKQTRFGTMVAKTLPFRAVRSLERRLLNRQANIPFEIEFNSWHCSHENIRDCDPVFLCVVFNDLDALRSKFLSSPHVKTYPTLTPNPNKTALPVLYNKMASRHRHMQAWLAFCHQDFVLREDLRVAMAGKDAHAVYGVSGARIGSPFNLGRIQQTDDTYAGQLLPRPVPVQTLDECCLIIHTSLLDHLSFDDRFKFHFYGADLCMQAHVNGFGVYALQVDCQHKSRTIHGDTASLAYHESLKLFADKWTRFLPVKTTTALITGERQ